MTTNNSTNNALRSLAVQAHDLRSKRDRNVISERTYGRAVYALMDELARFGGEVQAEKARTPVRGRGTLQGDKIIYTGSATIEGADDTVHRITNNFTGCGIVTTTEQGSMFGRLGRLGGEITCQKCIAFGPPYGHGAVGCAKGPCLCSPR